MSMTDYRINPKTGLEFGLYSLGDHMPDALISERVSAKERVAQIIQEAKLAEDAGLDFLVSAKVTNNILLAKLMPFY